MMATQYKEEEDPANFSDSYNQSNIGYVIKEQDRWLPIANGKYSA